MNSLFPPGAQLGPYELLLPLPRTGAAQVYIARFHGAGAFRTRVTVKTIPRAYLDDLPTEHLLREQAALAAQIRHPNLVEVLDMGEHDDTVYVAMEWVDGEPLQALLSESLGTDAMPLALAVNLAGQACRGLHAIHEFRDLKGLPAGAVHGHVSPQNLLLAYNGTVKVSDFGVARAMDRISFLTRATQQHNKLTFVSPEQLSARPVDARSDVFSIGTLLFLLTTGRHPFEGADVRETLNNICSAEPASPPAAVLPGYRDELGAVVSKALRKAPEERFSSALEFLNALERAMPACFHATSEQCLATYLERFFAAHKLALHARVHAAEQQQDKRRASVPAPRPRQHSSLRAVALELEVPVESAPTTQRSPREIRVAAVHRFVGRSLGLTLGIALPFLFALGFGLWYELTPGRESRAGAALASQLQIGSVSAMMLAPLPEPTLAPPPEATLAANAPGAQPSAPTPIDISELPPERPPIAAAVREQRAKPVEVGRTRPSPASASAAPSAAPPPATATRMNAWDPSTFGGRY
jgi:eukaryotic-like serine/threonine-protein kinase